jgi:hypothetical protein
MKPGRAGTMTYGYKRHGTTTLFAAPNRVGKMSCIIMNKSIIHQTRQ